MQDAMIDQWFNDITIDDSKVPINIMYIMFFILVIKTTATKISAKWNLLSKCLESCGT